jgi:hypothetical protein
MKHDLMIFESLSTEFKVTLCMYVCMYFFIVRISMLHYTVVILHASLYICVTFRFRGYSDQFVNGFPLQVSSLHCYILALYNIEYTVSITITEDQS